MCEHAADAEGGGVPPEGYAGIDPRWSVSKRAASAHRPPRQPAIVLSGQAVWLVLALGIRPPLSTGGFIASGLVTNLCQP